MKGQQVVVRAFGGEGIIRRIWSSNTEVVYVTDDTQLALLMEGKPALEPIGIHRRDVFKYKPELSCGSIDWSMMELWEET